MKRFLLCFILCGLALNAFAVDFGFITDQKGELADTGGGNAGTYTGVFTPWVSLGLTGDIEIYASGVFSIKYEYISAAGSGAWTKPPLLFEPGRTGIAFKPLPLLSVEAGRINFSDTSGLVASGLFDGLHLGLDLPVKLSLGAFYTGLLYKETAEIAMTNEDMDDYQKAWDSWGNSYFAPRRLLASLRATVPMGSSLDTITLEGIVQADLSNHREKLHSQFIEAAYRAGLFQWMNLNAGLAVELKERSGAVSGADLEAGMEAYLSLGADLPTSIADTLFLGFRFSSGDWNDTFTAFTPVSGHTQSAVFTLPFQRLSVISLTYEGRVLSSLSLNGGIKYFLRTDTADDGLALGGEFQASLLWAPVDEILLTLHGGVFLPGMGNIDPQGDIQWKFGAGLTLSL